MGTFSDKTTLDINEQLKIINEILLLNSKFLRNHSILSGKLGLVLNFFLYGTYSRDEQYLDFALDLLNDCIEYYGKDKLGLDDGISGLGRLILLLGRQSVLEDYEAFLKIIDDDFKDCIQRNPDYGSNFLNGNNGIWLYMIDRGSELFEFRIPEETYLREKIANTVYYFSRANDSVFTYNKNPNENILLELIAIIDLYHKSKLPSDCSKIIHDFSTNVIKEASEFIKIPKRKLLEKIANRKATQDFIYGLFVCYNILYNKQSDTNILIELFDKINDRQIINVLINYSQAKLLFGDLGIGFLYYLLYVKHNMEAFNITSKNIIYSALDKSLKNQYFLNRNLGSDQFSIKSGLCGLAIVLLAIYSSEIPEWSKLLMIN
ncbi:MAG: hypothetical protein ACFFDF_09285 [Candidatus Odinarchaeota archaeon]